MDRSKLNRTVLWRQRTVLSLAGALAVAVAAAMVLLGGSDTQEIASTALSLAMPGDGVEEAELWRSSAERDIRELADRSSAIDSAIDRLGERVRLLADSLEKQMTRQREEDFEREIVRLTASGDPAGQGRLSPVPLARSETLSQPPVAQADRPRRIRLVRLQDPRAVSDLPAAARAEKNRSQSAADSAVSPPARGGARGRRIVINGADDGYLPAGSFMRAVILGGLDAPTSGAAQDNPHPVLLRVSGKARLPGLVSLDMRECLVLAAGYGDISSERALLRTESMSCLRGDGTFFDAQVRGFIVGEDGRAGVRGRLVSQRGEQLSRALLAGTAAGLGNVLSLGSGARASRVGADGVLRGFDVGELASSGAAGGFSTALDRLAQYYIQMADQLHPVVEVGAGRTVDIVLQQGVDLGTEDGLAG